MKRDWPTLAVGGLLHAEVVGKLIAADRTQGSFVRPKRRIDPAACTVWRESRD